MDYTTPKKVSESSVDDYVYHILNKDLNHIDTMFGGEVMLQLDLAAATVAARHSNRACVTFIVDRLKFIGPAFKGEMLVYKASVNRVWNTSMEVGVKVFAENPLTGERRPVVRGYITFVAKDDQRNNVAIRQVIPETDEQRRRYEAAEIRRKNSKALDEELKTKSAP